MAMMTQVEKRAGTEPSSGRAALPARGSWLGRISALLLVVGALSVLGGRAAIGQQTGFQVVANLSVTADAMSKKDLARLFLKLKGNWPDGKPATPVDLKADSAVREAFSNEVLGKSMTAVESFWNGQVFAAKASPPKTLATEQEVLSFVRATPGAVGYVGAGTALAGVKTLAVAP